MEYGSIERELYIDASREVVFEVLTKPEHIQRMVERRRPTSSRARARRAR